MLKLISLLFIIIFLITDSVKARKPVYGQGHVGGIYYRTPQGKEYAKFILGGDIGINFLRAGIRLLPFDWVDVYAKLGSDSFWIYGGRSISLSESMNERRSFVGIEFSFIQFSLIFEYAEHNYAEDNFGAGIIFHF